MFAGNTRSLPYIRNYAEADAYWRKTKKPPRSKKWDECQRPLKNTSSWHYRIEKSLDGNAYDLCLYHTVMARYHKPTPDGYERRQYTGHDSQTSKAFLRCVIGVQDMIKVRTTDNREVLMPIPSTSMQDTDFSCDAWFIGNRLDVARSKHTPLHKRVSSDEDKLKRKMLKAKFEPLLTLCAMRMPELEATVSADFLWVQSFSAAINAVQHRALREMVSLYEHGQPAEQRHIDLFMEAAPRVYRALVSYRAYIEKKINWNTMTCSAAALDKPVTEKEFMQSLWSTVSRTANLNAKTGSSPYPQFPEPDQITLSNVFARR